MDQHVGHKGQLLTPIETELTEAIEYRRTRLETCAALPHSSWEATRNRIAQVHGTDIKEPETGFLAPFDTIPDYLKITLKLRGVAFRNLENYS
jgi:hypothetical protein